MLQSRCGSGKQITLDQRTDQYATNRTDAVSRLRSARGGLRSTLASKNHRRLRQPRHAASKTPRIRIGRQQRAERKGAALNRHTSVTQRPAMTWSRTADERPTTDDNPTSSTASINGDSRRGLEPPMRHAILGPSRLPHPPTVFLRCQVYQLTRPPTISSHLKPDKPKSRPPTTTAGARYLDRVHQCSDEPLEMLARQNNSSVVSYEPSDDEDNVHTICCCSKTASVSASHRLFYSVPVTFIDSLLRRQNDNR